MHSFFLLAAASLALAHGPCQQSENGNYGCDNSNVLWQCNGSNWVVLNDCGSQNLVCNSVASSASTIGCSPQVPTGLVSCTVAQFGSYQCVGLSFQQCAYDPWWVEMVQCRSNELCVVNAGGFSGCLPVGVAGVVSGGGVGGGVGGGSVVGSNSVVSSSTRAAAVNLNAVSYEASSDTSSSSKIPYIVGGVAAVAVIAVVGAVAFSKTVKAKKQEILTPTEGLLTA